MNKRIGTMRAVFVLAACGTLVSLVSSCTTQPAPAPVQAPRPTAQIVGPQPVNSNAVSQKRDTGTYPTFGAPMTAAGTQMTNEEAASMQDSLSKVGAARRSGQISEAEYKRRIAELRALAEQQAPGATTPASQ
jgi:hypothetical protein